MEPRLASLLSAATDGCTHATTDEETAARQTLKGYRQLAIGTI